MRAPSAAGPRLGKGVAELAGFHARDRYRQAGGPDLHPFGKRDRRPCPGIDRGDIAGRGDDAVGPLGGIGNVVD